MFLKLLYYELLVGYLVPIYKALITGRVCPEGKWNFLKSMYVCAFVYHIYTN